MDFIHDIVKCGDNIVISCNDCTIEGVVVKINNNLIAVKQSNGSIILKEDNDIINIKVVNQDSQSSKEKNVTDIPRGKVKKKVYLKREQFTELYQVFINKNYPETWKKGYAERAHCSLGLFLAQYLCNGFNLADAARLRRHEKSTCDKLVSA
ncbi:MAG: hypothetical protein K6F94_03875 [Bacteroidaceae bacterium]|nr:hypothetical protein [Bacteroidaceae bacterium]